MKVFKRILLVLLAVLLLVQIPFIYRRYETGKVAEKIAELDAQRVNREDPKYKEYKGIIHAHTSLGGHSTGGFDELINAANANDLDFVLMTEHYSDKYDTSALTLNGVYGKTLFVGGNEIDTADGDRFLMIPGSAEAASFRNMPTNAVLEKLHAENRLALITYPEKFKSWDSNFDGIEVFSLHTAAKKANPLLAFFDLLWSYPAYPQLTLMRYLQRPDENLQKFDEIAAKRPISLFAGTDAHSNIGFHVFGDDAGNRLINIKIDPYEAMFRIARVHVLIEKDKPFDRDSLIDAIRAGRYFIGFDALGDSTGFDVSESKRRMDESEDIEAGSSPETCAGDVREPCRFVRFKLPSKARAVVLRNGQPFLDIPDTTDVELKITNQGEFRIEVYRDDLGSPFDKMPWIISNPIDVR